MKYYKNSIYFLLTLLIISCTEPFNLKTLTIENLLVVEALITNEFKNHQIKLFRSFEIDSNNPVPELNASVYVIDNFNTTYNFNEISNGIYSSETKFSAEKDKIYTLKIKTNNNKTYTSQPEQLPGISEIQGITTSAKKNKFEEPQIIININSIGDDNAKYYRFEYEETYKIIAPYWSPFKFMFTDTGEIEVVPKTNLTGEVCYNTLYSKSIIQTETNSLFQNKIADFPLLLINEFDYKISHRYSVLVKQYVQNLSSYNYLNTLNKLSTKENLFSDTQKGFIKGNIQSDKEIDEKIVGYFEVSSVSKKRVFFNHSQLPTSSKDLNNLPYFKPCLINNYNLKDIYGDDNVSILNGMESGEILYYKLIGTKNAPYLSVEKVCGDCTVLGSNVKPNFWID